MFRQVYGVCGIMLLRSAGKKDVCSGRPFFCQELVNEGISNVCRELFYMDMELFVVQSEDMTLFRSAKKRGHCVYT